MTNIVILDSKRNRDIKVAFEPRLTPQDGLGHIQVFPSELEAAHKEFPVFFKKHSGTGQFFLVAILSLQENGNIFSSDGSWDSRYIPLMSRRGPCMIGRNDGSLSLCVDLNDARVGEQGQRLFDEQGFTTETAKEVARILSVIHQGKIQSDHLMDALNAESLIEPISVAYPKGAPLCNLQGLYSINPRKLQDLQPAPLQQLNRSGALRSAYLLASSAANLDKLWQGEERMPNADKSSER
ncbi:SapC family protein [uncultured Microbulbifer sp.]|uniref:SapC family protein n=1 Tax=uncultured Microbulbifer sp. TaxID=348147 RepID=UPI00261A6937|nr:SapC family protein [uncultured Microbulbifer sp.]